MARVRVIVGAFGDDRAMRGVAHRLRDAGHEVVLVGGGQSAEQLVRTAVAEDASRIVVDDDAAGIERLQELCREMGVEAPEVGTEV